MVCPNFERCPVKFSCDFSATRALDDSAARSAATAQRAISLLEEQRAREPNIDTTNSSITTAYEAYLESCIDLFEVIDRIRSLGTRLGTSIDPLLLENGCMTGRQNVLVDGSEIIICGSAAIPDAAKYSSAMVLPTT